ncbi:MAG: hypothetical protein JNK85_00585 [Verrucomicrobiales bacterium]|nr:hypothetical protein [Verrucomicrobiales bacterium]
MTASDSNKAGTFMVDAGSLPLRFIVKIKIRPLSAVGHSYTPLPRRIRDKVFPGSLLGLMNST